MLLYNNSRHFNKNYSVHIAKVWSLAKKYKRFFVNNVLGYRKSTLAHLLLDLGVNILSPNFTGT